MRQFIQVFLFAILLVSCSPNTTITVIETVSDPNKPGNPKPLLLDDTGSIEFKISDFSAIHSQVNGDTNEHLIFGNLPVMDNPDMVPQTLSVFLGRWEGFSYAPPVKKDRKLVIHISEISANEGKMFVWTGTNLQFPDQISEIHFRVLDGDLPMLESRMTWIDGTRMIYSFTYDSKKDILRGTTKLAGTSQIRDSYELTRNKEFYVYKEYAKYLAGKSITTHEYKTRDIAKYGSGYMLYLPDGYHTETQEKWPLIFFLHGAGDRGENLYVLAKASPFMYIREKGPLSAIIVAPLLGAHSEFALFPDEFMDVALEEILSEYRVDSDRVYLTGLSLGGEATYRFLLEKPELFAAAAPLCGFVLDMDPADVKKVKNIPIWAFHGADDQVVPLIRGQEPVDILNEAGGNVKFSVLPGHDHDVWTDTYSDPAFYEWLLDQKKS